MFDVGWTEFLLVGVVALLVIGPKDLPKAMRVAGHWVGRMRGVARQFRAGFDNIVREAELEEMEKRWAAENARIMAAHPATPAAPVHETAAPHDPAPEEGRPTAAEHDPFGVEPDVTAAPVFVDQPQIRPAPGEPHTPPGAGVTS